VRRRTAAGRRRAGAFALAIVFGLAAGGARANASCAPLEFGGAGYTVCSFDVRRDEIRLYWKDSTGKPYANFAALALALIPCRRWLATRMGRRRRAGEARESA